VLLREKTATDAAQEYVWQTDIQLCRLNAVKPLNIPYNEYEKLYIANLNNPSLGIQLAIEVDGRHIGNCAAYNFDPISGSAEVGIIIGSAYDRCKGYGYAAMKKFIGHLFDQRDIYKLKLKTLKDNLAAQHCFTKCGFQNKNESFIQGQIFILMELNRHDYEKIKAAF